MRSIVALSEDDTRSTQGCRGSSERGGRWFRQRGGTLWEPLREVPLPNYRHAVRALTPGLQLVRLDLETGLGVVSTEVGRNARCSAPIVSYPLSPVLGDSDLLVSNNNGSDKTFI